MQISAIYITNHTYSRIIERLLDKLDWTKEQPFKYYEDFLFCFFDELFRVNEVKKITINSKGKKYKEYRADISILGINYTIPMQKVNENSIYIPTILYKEKYFGEKKLLEWLYPVEIIPKRPNIESFHNSDKLQILLKTEELVKAIRNYEIKTSYEGIKKVYISREYSILY